MHVFKDIYQFMYNKETKAFEKHLALIVRIIDSKGSLVHESKVSNVDLETMDWLALRSFLKDGGIIQLGENS